MKPRYAREPRFIRNFIDEARIAVTLNHRNIVQVFEFGKADGELLLAMELLEGVDLRTAMQRAKQQHTRLPAALSCYIMSDVATGLDYAHRKCDSDGNLLGIVHCDVSPHNVLLSNEGFVKILDFGVARARFVATPSSKRLRGKPRYMSPEQTLGETATPASDVFVVGILAWELLSGQQLFDGPRLKDILAAVRSEEIQDLARLRPELPAFLCKAVMRALQRTPEERGSAADIGIQLARAGRELSETTSAQALSKWLSESVPLRNDARKDPPRSNLHLPSRSVNALHPDELTANQAPQPDEMAWPQERPGMVIAEDLATSEARIDSSLNAEVLELGEPSLSALLDKRRVVVAILLLDGSDHERRHQLSLALCDLAYKRGAVVHESSDREVVAIFGLQLAGEDDVASAMHFAIDAAELAREATPNMERHGDGITLRSATRAGVVAQRREHEYQLRGDALREARELARSAETGRPLLSGGTGRLSSAHFLFRELPARRYRSRRLRVLELVGPVGHNDRLQAMRSRRGRFVGRASELNRLWQAFERSVQANSIQIVVVEGAPGLGKSRLIAEFIARLDALEASPLLVAMASTQSAAAAPFACAIEYLQVALKLAPARGEQARNDLLQRLRGSLRDGLNSDAWLKERTRCIEFAMELRDGVLNPAEDAPAALRERCAESIRSLHGKLAAGRPSVVILENFHLADEASTEVLHSLLRQSPCDAPTLLIMTSRDETIGQAFPDALIISLADLEEEERVQLIADRLGDARTGSVVHEVSRRTGGNPLFIEELCRIIREVGWDQTPATVRDAVIARVERLSHRSRAILQRAAVIGESFRAHILEELIAAPAAKNLQELIDEHLLLRSDQADYEAEGGEFSFRHGLIQEVVYASLSVGARRSTHANLGRLLALRAEAGREEPPALTAYHLELGGDHKRAAHYWTRAGQVAQTAFEVKAARDAYSRAIDLHRRQTDGQALEEVELIEALFGRARAFRDLGDNDSEGLDLASLEALCRDRPK